MYDIVIRNLLRICEDTACPISGLAAFLLKKNNNWRSLNGYKDIYWQPVVRDYRR
jgi:hypothetical protein